MCKNVQFSLLFKLTGEKKEKYMNSLKLWEKWLFSAIMEYNFIILNFRIALGFQNIHKPKACSKFQIIKPR